MATKTTEIHENMFDEMKNSVQREVGTEIGQMVANPIDRRAKEAVTKHLDFSHQFNIHSHDSENEQESTDASKKPEDNMMAQLTSMLTIKPPKQVKHKTC